MQGKFHELFTLSIYFQTIKEELEKRKKNLEQQARRIASTAAEGSTIIRGDQQMEQSPVHSVLTNFAMFVGLAVFAFAVKYVLRSIATQEYIQQ